MDRTTNDVKCDPAQLAEFFAAALEFIDPELGADAALDAIEQAAARKQRALASLPAPLAAADQAQLDEALAFIRRCYDRVPHATAAESTLADAAASNGNGSGNGNGHSGSGEAALESMSRYTTLKDAEATGADAPVSQESTDFRAAEPVLAENGASRFAELLESVEVQAADEAAAFAATGVHEARWNGAAQSAPLDERVWEPRRRRSPLSALWDEDAADEGRLPEQHAWPVVSGLLLLLGEAWLAGFAGWVATRFIAWPREGLRYELSWLGALGVVVLGLATAAVAALGIYRYRMQQGKLALLTHGAGALIALDLTAWALAAADAIPVIGRPQPFAWVLLIAGWAIAAAAAHLSDLRR